MPKTPEECSNTKGQKQKSTACALLFMDVFGKKGGGVSNLKYLLTSTSRCDHWKIIQHPTLRLCFSRYGPESNVIPEISVGSSYELCLSEGRSVLTAYISATDSKFPRNVSSCVPFPYTRLPIHQTSHTVRSTSVYVREYCPILLRSANNFSRSLYYLSVRGDGRRGDGRRGDGRRGGES